MFILTAPVADGPLPLITIPWEAIVVKGAGVGDIGLGGGTRLTGDRG